MKQEQQQPLDPQQQFYQDVQRGDQALKLAAKMGWLGLRDACRQYLDVLKGNSDIDDWEGSAWKDKDIVETYEKMKRLLENNSTVPARMTNTLVQRVVPRVEQFFGYTKPETPPGTIGKAVDAFGNRFAAAHNTIAPPLTAALIYANREQKRLRQEPQIRERLTGLYQSAKDKVKQRFEKPQPEPVYETIISVPGTNGRPEETPMTMSRGEVEAFIKMGISVTQGRDGKIRVEGTSVDRQMLQCYQMVRGQMFKNFDQVNETVTIPLRGEGDTVQQVKMRLADLLEMQQNGYTYDHQQALFVRIEPPQR